MNKKKNHRLSAEERKVQILKAAQALCSRKGFAGTTLDDIAKKAGVSRALVVQHFKNKEKLYEVLIDFLFKTHPLEKDPDIKKCIEKRDDFGVFKNYFQHIFKYMSKDKEHSPLRLLLFSILEKPSLYKKHYNHRRLKGLTVLENYIQMRIEEGEFKSVNPKYVAISFTTMVMSLVLQQITFSIFDTEKEFINCLDTMIKILVDGLKN